MDAKAKFKVIQGKCYKDQAIWVLNAFWKTRPAFGDNLEEAEKVWQYYMLLKDLDKAGEEGSCLDEFQAHRVLEKLEEALTVRDMRETLTKADLDFDKRISLCEFMIYKYKVEWKDLVEAPQGDQDDIKIREAAEMVEKAQAAMAECEAAAEKAKAEKAAASDAAAAAFRDEQAAKEKEATAVAAEEEQKAMEQAVADALAVLQREEDAYKTKCETLETTGSDMSIGIVKRNTAKQELAQLKASDPMPLQRAKITQEAALRKQARATKSAAAARVAASGARSTAEKSREEAQAAEALAEKAAEDAIAAVATSIKAFNDALAFLEKTKLECQGSGQGKLWWMGRELEEAKKYMSQAQLAKLAASQA